MALEFKCNDLGYTDCKWKAISNTTDKLVDLVAVHLRDQHNIMDFNQEMITQVKNKSYDTKLAPGEGELEVKEYKCPKCDWRYIAQTADLITDAVALHERDDHDVNSFTQEMIAAVKNNLKPWSGD